MYRELHSPEPVCPAQLSLQVIQPLSMVASSTWARSLSSEVSPPKQASLASWINLFTYQPAMFQKTLCSVLAFAFWAPILGGPMTKPYPGISDQELFWGSDQYDFAVVLPAAGIDCFWHFAHHGERFYLSFMVQWVTGVGQDRHLSVTVNAPSSLLVSTIDDARGQVNFEAAETGFYQMCFNNFHNRFNTMQVFLSFGVYYESNKDPTSSKEGEEEKMSEEMNNTLSAIETVSHRVENRIFHMFRYYSFGRMRKSADFFLLQSNSRYITWWSTALSLLIVTSGYLQLRFLKSLFITKTVTEGDKPRC
ncbi:transmembrane emp24 domain-containing protein 6 [Pholidichthys leucotaenia]